VKDQAIHCDVDRGPVQKTMRRHPYIARNYEKLLEHEGNFPARKWGLQSYNHNKQM
jgi:hypothetical protein